MKTMGMRHVALNVKDAQSAKNFFCQVLKMQVEWEPDPKNIYLTSVNSEGPGLDNLAIHEAEASPAKDDVSKPDIAKPGLLDHLGFFVPTVDDVDAWHAHVKACGANILREIKTHRDGARSFYFEGPDGLIIQLLYHIPVAKRIPLPPLKS